VVLHRDVARTITAAYGMSDHDTYAATKGWLLLDNSVAGRCREYATLWHPVSGAEPFNSYGIVEQKRQLTASSERPKNIVGQLTRREPSRKGNSVTRSLTRSLSPLKVPPSGAHLTAESVLAEY
jgi:hypothetical protein